MVCPPTLWNLNHCLNNGQIIFTSSYKLVLVPAWNSKGMVGWALYEEFNLEQGLTS